jgi:hypothetical protein
MNAHRGHWRKKHYWITNFNLFTYPFSSTIWPMDLLILKLKLLSFKIRTVPYIEFILLLRAQTKSEFTTSPFSWSSTRKWLLWMFFCMGVKFGVSHLGRNADSYCWKVERWAEYSDSGWCNKTWKILHNPGHHNCTLHLVLIVREI